ncbi:acyl-CoA dehydrogenase family protein [Streptomyces sp. NPDC055089]
MHHSAAGALDALLGRPGEEHGAFRPADLAGLDEREEFPAAACGVLDAFGLNDHYVPAAFGGELRDYTDLMQLLRTVARRDLTVAVAHGKTFLGAAPVWVAGGADQAAALGALIADGAVVSWGLTERAHGSDLLAGELSATRESGGWRLNGEKWLINNATRGGFICVLARTDLAGGPRGFSLFLVDKRGVAADAYSYPPKIPTHGIRGADISGIAFHNALIPGSALVGEVGTGIETVLKALQLTRTASTALSLGAGDTALRLGVDYARNRRLYGRTLGDLPRVRRIIGEVYAAQLLAEATGLVAARSVHALPGEMSVVSAVAKALIPDLAQNVLDRVAELLGVRSFLTQEYADGLFAKLERDHRVVAIFDGNTAVNRNALIDQFPLLAAAYRRRRCDEAGVTAATSLSVPSPEFTAGGLSLLAMRGSSLMQSLPAAVARIAEQAERGLLPRQVVVLAEEVEAAADALHTEFAELRRTPQDVPPTAFVLAERYELCFAATACLQLWLNNPRPAGDAHSPTIWRNALWLQAALRTALTRLGSPLEEAGAEAYDRLAEHAFGPAVPTLRSTLDGSTSAGFTSDASPLDGAASDSSTSDGAASAGSTSDGAGSIPDDSTTDDSTTDGETAGSTS